MEAISVTNISGNERGWQFCVEVGSQPHTTKHQVFLDQEYYQKLTKGQVEPSILVTKSFEFLLQRESKESILRTFNLSVIETYFPEYPEKIKATLP